MKTPINESLMAEWVEAQHALSAARATLSAAEKAYAEWVCPLKAGDVIKIPYKGDIVSGQVTSVCASVYSATTAPARCALRVRPFGWAVAEVCLYEGLDVNYILLLNGKEPLDDCNFKR